MDLAVKSQNSVKNVEIYPTEFCKRAKHNTVGIGMKLSKKYQCEEVKLFNSMISSDFDNLV